MNWQINWIKKTLLGESFSEIGFSGQRSFLALHPIEMETGKFHVEMEIRIFKDEGILFYVEKSNVNFVCLSLMGGVIELRVQTGNKNKIGSMKAHESNFTLAF